MSVPYADLVAGIAAVKTMLDLIQRGMNGSITEEEYRERMAVHEDAIKQIDDRWEKRNP